MQTMQLSSRKCSAYNIWMPDINTLGMQRYGQGDGFMGGSIKHYTWSKIT